MIRILKEWEGKFEIDGKEKDNLDDVEFKDGENFHIRLIPERGEKND